MGAILFLIRCKTPGRSEVADQYKNYIAVPGKIMNKQQRVGSKSRVIITYTIQYKTLDDIAYSQTVRNLDETIAGSYDKGDTLTVYYNPSNPNDPIVDGARMDTSPRRIPYAGILPYALGALVLFTAFYFYKVKKQ